jgi:hypothetical protein
MRDSLAEAKRRWAARRVDRAERSRVRDRRRAGAQERPVLLRPQRLWLHIGLMLVLTAMLAAAAGWVVWWSLAKPDLSAPPSPGAPAPSAGPGLSAAERLDSMKVLLAIVGGLGAVAALTVGYRKQRTGENADRRERTKAVHRPVRRRRRPTW